MLLLLHLHLHTIVLPVQNVPSNLHQRVPQLYTLRLQVSGEAVLRGLNAVLAAATDVEAAKPALDGYSLVVRLAGVLGLDALSETCVAGELPFFNPNIIGRGGWCSIASIASTGTQKNCLCRNM